MKNKRMGFFRCGSAIVTVNIAVFVAFIWLGLCWHRAHAATIWVNSTSDIIGNDGACTLREAIINANNNNQSGSTDCAAGDFYISVRDVIAFDPSLAGQSVVLNGSELAISSKMRIDGLGQSQLSIDGDGQSRVFALSSLGDVIMNDLTIENGMAPRGGGIVIDNGGDLTLNRVRVRSNLASGTDMEVQGGGIFAGSSTQIVINDSLIESNEARATATTNGAASANGGGLAGRGSWTLTNVTVRGNEATAVDNGFSANTSGGGIGLESASFTGTSLLIENNHASQNDVGGVGGGVSSRFGSVVIENSIIRENDVGSSGASWQWGGGFSISESIFELTDSIVANNSARIAGGLFMQTSSCTRPHTLDGVTIRHNVAQHSGGGIFLDIDSNFTCPPMLANLLVQGNMAQLGDGGGLFTANALTLTIQTSTFATNTAQTDDGGGIWASGDRVTIDDTTFYGNDANDDGGGIYFGSNSGSQLHIRNSTFRLNSAASGGGIYHAVGNNSTIANSTFSQNLGSSITNGNGNLTLTNITAVNGGGYHVHRVGGTVNLRNSLLAMSGGFSCSGTINTGGYPNMATDSSCGATIVSGSGLPLGISMNGGYTKTFLPYSYSNAVDAGHNGLCAALGNVDQRGLTRPVDGNGSSGDGNACDLGAVERQPCVAMTEPVVNTAVVGDDVTLSWAPVSGASLYNVYGSTTDAYFLVLLPIAQGGATTYEANNVLSSSKAAYYAVRSENECGNLSPFTNQRVGVFQFELEAGN